jgi:predicted nucleic acid-binding protein
MRGHGLRAQLREYYRPSDVEFQALWADALFVFDANVLLNLYRYSPGSSDELLKLIEQLAAQSRVWVPYRVAHEYQRNRIGVILEQRMVYDDVVGRLQKMKTSTQGELSRFARSEHLGIEEHIDAIGKAFDDAVTGLQSKQAKLADTVTRDGVLDRLTDALSDAVGSRPTDEDFAKSLEVAKSRHDKRQAPGCGGDDDKPEPDRYGDTLIWLEILAKAKEARRPIIFVTDDGKDDWWTRVKGKTVGPLPALVREIHEVSKQSFFMYDVHAFLTHANARLDMAIPPEAIEGTREALPVDQQRDNSRWLFETYASLMQRRRRLLSELEVADLMVTASTHDLARLNDAIPGESKEAREDALRRYDALEVRLEREQATRARIDESLRELDDDIRHLGRRLVSPSEAVPPPDALLSWGRYFRSNTPLQDPRGDYPDPGPA